jgi:hypothetical protein
MPPANDHKQEEAAYKLLSEGMHPSTRDCDPRAYFRAKLVGLRKARESLLTDDEYAAERQEVLCAIILPARYPRFEFPILIMIIIGGVAATVYGLATVNVGWVVAPLAVTAYALWSLHGFRRHHAWLNAMSHSQRADVIRYLRDCELIEGNEASNLLSSLEKDSTNTA